VLCTDPDVLRRKDAVREFVVRWIGLGKQTPARHAATLDAAEGVLLSACWREPAGTVDLTLGTGLRTRVRVEARWHRPIWDNQVRGYSIDLLDRPVGRSDLGEPSTLAQVVPDPRDDYAMVDGGLDAGRRFQQIAPLLKPEHLRVALQQAHGDVTWQEAARRAGLPAAAGESARRRIRRVSVELQRRRRLGGPEVSGAPG
jgi:hypothetical protein